MPMGVEALAVAARASTVPSSRNRPMLRAVELAAYRAEAGAIVQFAGPHRLGRGIFDRGEKCRGAFRRNRIADPAVAPAPTLIEQIVRARVAVRRERIPASLRPRRPFRRRFIGGDHLDARAAQPALLAFRLKEHTRPQVSPIALGLPTSLTL